MPLDPMQLAALAAVLRRGSFEHAATDLAVTPSAISQRIKALEERIGTALVLRATPCTATPTGARLAKHAEDVGLLETQLRRDLELDSENSPARLRVAVPADSLATWFIQAMAPIKDMLFDLVIDDQDHSADWLRRGEVNAAVTSSGKAVSGCTRVPLGSLRYLATASPDFVDRWFGDGVTARTLAQAPCLTFNPKDTLQSQWMQAQTGARLSPPSHFLPSTHAFIDAARAGLGWGMNPELLIRGPIRNRRLIALNPNLPLDTPLDWQVSRILAPALAPLTHAVRAAAQDRLIPIS
jgi:LysR family transcriptional regulator (chromosome initiation inhibitor)